MPVMSPKQELKKISPEEVMEHFHREGMEITKEEAELIIDFLSSLTLMVIEQYFGKNNGCTNSTNKPTINQSNNHKSTMNQPSTIDHI